MPYDLKLNIETQGIDNLVRVRAEVLQLQNQYKSASTEVKQSIDRIVSAEAQAAEAIGKGHQALGETILQAVQQDKNALDGLIRKELELKAAIDQVSGAHQHNVTQVAAVGGAIRVAFGEQSIRSVENFLAKTLGLGPALQSVFAVTGAVALAEVIFKAGVELEKFAEKWDPVILAEKRAVDTAKELNKVIQSLGDSIRSQDLENLTDAVGKSAGKSYSADAAARRSAANETFVVTLRQQLAEAEQRKAAAERTISRQGALIEPGQQSVFAQAAADAREATADIKNLNLQLQAFTRQQVSDQQTVTKLLHEGTEQQLQDNEQKARDLQQKADEAARKAKEIDAYVRGIEKRGVEATLGPVGRLLTERDASLERFALSRQQQGTVEFSFQQQIGQALKKEEEAQKRLPLTLDRASFEEIHGFQARDIDTETQRGLERNAKAILDERRKANEEQKKQDEADFAGLRSGADQQARLVGLQAKHGDELAALRQELDIRKQAAEIEFSIKEQHAQIYDLDVERAKLNKENADAEFKYTEAIIQLRNKQIADFKSTFVKGAEDILSGKGVGNIFKDLTSGLEKQVLGNVAELIYPQFQKITSSLHVGGDSGVLGKLLKGTPFGADPVAAATASNTAATVANTTATTQLATVLSGGGTGTIGAGASGIGSIFGGSTSSPFVFNALSGSNSTGPLGEDGLPTFNNPVYSKNAFPSFSGPSSGFGLNARTIGGLTAAGGGAFAAFSDFRSGGAKNDVAGVGAALGSAAGVAALFGPAGAPVALGLGIAAAATSFISSLFPDPKKIREQQIQKTLEQNKYYAPESVTRQQDTSGNFVDFDARGNLRQSAFRAVPQVSQPYQFWRGNTPYDVPGSITSPYSPAVTINIHANDASSFVDMARRSSSGLADVIADHVQGSEGRLSQAIAYRVAR